VAAYDVIVVGTGGVGSAALMHLAERGARVLGLDRFEGGHDRGSSHGQTRIIRQAYFEHPDYVPLLRRAYELWAKLEHEQEEQLFHQAGLLQVGPSDGTVIPGVLESARRHGIAVERFTACEAAKRFPGFHVPDRYEAVFEPTAGYLLVEQCVLAHLSQARRWGAEIRSDVTVHSLATSSDEVAVLTDGGTLVAPRVVVTAGAWSHELLGKMPIRLRVLRKHLHWLANDDARYRRDGGCPTFLYELPEGTFYGFPQFDEWGVKAAMHSGGEEVDDPLTVDRGVDAAEFEQVRSFVAAHLPGVSNRATHHATCLYTMSPDENFLVDKHPQNSHVVLAAGLSGHGFKFTSVLGEALADMALEGRTDLPIGFLGLNRFDDGA
jgi:monomeric sarcosine oxidase